MKNAPINSEYLNSFPGNFKNTESNLRPFYHTNLNNSLENIVFKDKPENEKGLLEKMFSDKSKTSKASVKALLEEIKLRERLDTQLINNIDNEICRQHTLLSQLENLKVHYIWDQFTDMSKIKMQLENNALELEKEKRKEYLECWRDLMFLKKYLLIALKDYWDLIKKREVLSCDVSELFNNENNERN